MKSTAIKWLLLLLSSAVLLHSVCASSSYQRPLQRRTSNYEEDDYVQPAPTCRRAEILVYNADLQEWECLKWNKARTTTEPAYSSGELSFDNGSSSSCGNGSIKLYVSKLKQWKCMPWNKRPTSADD